MVLMAGVASYTWWDISVAEAVARGPGWVRWWGSWVSELGKAEWWLIPSGGLAVWWWRRGEMRPAWRSGYVFAAVAAAGLIVHPIKWAAGRYRPLLWINDGLYGMNFWVLRPGNYEQSSLPSGHAAVVFAWAAAMTILFPRRWWGWLLVAGVIAGGRVMCNAHYISVVVAGGMLGAVTAWGMRGMAERGRERCRAEETQA
ncbi:MAG: phosphatase PAP2 family protein [Phycisphaeraceae bacterium]|nr:phosphatase PAP2 family protein [Phycisphaeraceae bacterium]